MARYIVDVSGLRYMVEASSAEEATIRAQEYYGDQEVELMDKT